MMSGTTHVEAQIRIFFDVDAYKMYFLNWIVRSVMTAMAKIEKSTACPSNQSSLLPLDAEAKPRGAHLHGKLAHPAIQIAR